MKFVVGVLNLVFAFSVANANSNSCSILFAGPSVKDTWNQSVEAVQKLKGRVYGMDNLIEAMTTAMLAKEFMWINGEPGGAKTFLSKLVFESALNSISDSEKRIFIIQFHKLITESKITGFSKFEEMMKDGRNEIETESSLINNKYIFLIADEAEKANPATLNSLLSVLNERKAFHGNRVLDAALSSGVFTSNKTTGEFIEGSVTDRQAGEALLDRMAIKVHALNQQVNVNATVAMYNSVKSANNDKIVFPALALQELVAKVKIPNNMMAEIVRISRAFDNYTTGKWSQSKAERRYGLVKSESFPANQFSTRSHRRLVQVFKASLIARQLMEGVSIENLRLAPRREDMALLVLGAAYGGPASIRPKRYTITEEGKGVKVKSAYGSVRDSGMEAVLSPYEGRVYLQNSGGVKFILEKINGKWETTAISDPTFYEWTVVEESVAELEPMIAKVIADNNIDIKKPQFEIDTQIDAFVASNLLKERTEKELISIKKDTEHFVTVLNQYFDADPVTFTSKKQDFLPPRTNKDLRKFKRQIVSSDKEERMRRYYEWMVYEVKALKQRFVEMDHSIEAHLSAMLSNTHLFVFGPPGGAKTALAEVLLKAEIKKLNFDHQIEYFVKQVLPVVAKDKKFLSGVLNRMRAEKPKVVDRFLLQFHPLIPEGVLIGFPKVDKLLNKGIEEIEVSTSLANEKFIFAILDEIDKANQQTVSSLLSVLQERKIFPGGQEIKLALRTAISTSNKMPSEFLDSAGVNRPQNEAALDRHVSKVFVSNKISSEEELTQFLVNLENGISPTWKGFLAVGELAPIVERVEFENEVMTKVLATIHRSFLALRNKRERETQAEFETDARENPDYYVMASSSASNRSVIVYFDLIKSRFIINQLMAGIPFEKLRTKIELKDLGLFFEGLAYWSPQKLSFGYDADGILEFNRSTEVLDRLIASGIVDTRVKYHLEMMLEESRDYVQVLNTVVKGFLVDFKKEIAKYPDIFPSLFIDRKTREKNLAEQ